MVLAKPKPDGATLTIEVTVLEGERAQATGPASLFIDMFAPRDRERAFKTSSRKFRFLVCRSGLVDLA